METKHTKGEWSFDSFNNIWVDNKIKISISSVEDDETAEANAKLIAAAPEMLEALIKIRGIATKPNFDIDDIDEIISLSFNAIKKATE